MSRRRFLAYLLSLTLAASALVSCVRRPEEQVVCRVNGWPITASELAAALPYAPDSLLGEEGTKRRVLNDLVIRELIIREAEKRGLDKDIAYQMELDKKKLLIQELYNSVVAPGDRLTELELAAAYRMLQSESHMQIIAVAEESLARRLWSELAAGVPFETLAVRFSQHPSAPAGGDIGFLPELALEEPARSAVLALSPGQWTRPVKSGDEYRIVRVLERRPADPAPPPYQEMKRELSINIRRQQRRRLADEYVARLRSRLQYNERGLDILCKPVDSILPEEMEEWVAIRDSAKYVKVSRLLGLARRFPASLDTAMRKYAIRREIEDDLMYDDARQRGLDRGAEIRRQLEARRRTLLYQELYRREVVAAAESSEQQAGEVEARHKKFADSLLADAQVRVNKAALARVRFRRAK